MPDIILPPREIYTVLVAGYMNPAIHHPYWYRSIGAMDEVELQESQKLTTNATTPALSQVQFGSPRLSVTCQAGQWLIQSNDPALWERMVSITALVFSKLGETPVSAYGLLAQRHIKTESPDVKSAIASRICEFNLGFPSGKSTASSVQMTVIEEDYEVTALIQPSVMSEQSIFCQYHQQYQTPKFTEGFEHFEYFDVGRLLRGRLENYLSGSDTFFTDTVSAVNAIAIKGKSS
jgi:hypothetical protein